MIIIISPTKTFTNSTKKTKTKPVFLNESSFLINTLKKYSANDIKEKFKISEKLALDTYNYYKNISNEYAAAYLYGGTAFKYLDPLNIDEPNLSRLYILSAVYGILNANDGISPYRLEITDRSITNLYNYWQKPVNDYLTTLNKTVINLASYEYTKHLNLNNNFNIITIDFILIKNNKDTQQSMMLKKMRGLMANYILVNNIKNLDIIKSINIDGFIYNEAKSTLNNYIFIKEDI